MPKKPRRHRAVPPSGTVRRNHYEEQANRRAVERNQTRELPTNSSAWRRIREQQLDHEPLCRDCDRAGIVVAANEVDHIDGDYNNTYTADGNVNWDNLQSLCKPCHTRKTRRELAGKHPYEHPRIRGRK